MDDGDAGSGPGLTSDVVVLDMPVDRRARYTNAMASGAPKGVAPGRAGCGSMGTAIALLHRFSGFHDFWLFV